jgi:outer membrane protein assembly factor BamB
MPVTESLVDSVRARRQRRAMTWLTSGAFRCLAVLAALPAMAQADVAFSDLAGWWSADPAHGGESSHLALSFTEQDGRPRARLSIPAIGAYDIDLGEVTLSGNSLDTKALSFPLTWEPAGATLRGRIPAAAAPIYDIPVEFRRGEPLVKPPPKEWKYPRPRLAWSTDTGGSPVWAGLERDSDGTLYVGDDNGTLHAVDVSGRLRWKFDTGKAIRAQPRALDGHVFVASDSGYLYKLTRQGKEVWRARVAVDAPARIPTDQPNTRWDRYGSSVVLDGDRLFIASRDRNLYALDARSGRELWRVAAGDLMTATPALHGDLVIYAAFDGKVSAVSKRDGTPRWTHDAKLAVAGDITVSGDRVLLGSRSYDLVALDATTGRELWKHYYWFSWIESPPLVRDGVVYTGSSDATQVYAIDVATGSLRWKTAVPGYSWQRVAVDDAVLVAGTVGAGRFPGPRAGSLVAIERRTGAIRWMHLDPPADSVEGAKAWGFGASPVLAGDRVYAVDLKGRIHAFELP